MRDFCVLNQTFISDLDPDEVAGCSFLPESCYCTDCPFYWMKEESVMAEKYLRIDPSGEITWIQIDRVHYSWCDADGLSLDQVHAAIGCDCMEQVRTVIPGIVLLIDESGKIKDPPQRHNEVASRLYYGFLIGKDDIVGPAIVAAMRPTEPYGERDLFPLNQVELAKLSLCLGVELPDT